MVVQDFDPSQKTRDDIQTTSRCLVSGTDEVVGQCLNDGDGLTLLNRGDIFGNQDGLLRFDEDTTVSLILSTPRWWPGERVTWVNMRRKFHKIGAKR